MKHILLTPIVVTLLGCGSVPARDSLESGPLSHAVAWRTCAPWDGPAVALVFAGDSVAAETPVRPYVEFRIDRSAELLSGQRVQFDGSGSDSGSAVICGATERCDPVKAELEFGTAAPPADLTGRYRVMLMGAWVQGAFRARWLARQEMCG